MPKSNDFTINEVDSAYVDPADRFVVSLIVGYGAHGEVDTAEQALKAALELTRDAGCDGTQWHVHDRQTGETRLLEQSEFEAVHIA